jgi:hypothetical protein
MTSIIHPSKKHLKVSLGVTSLLASATSLCYLLHCLHLSDNFFAIVPSTFAIPLSVIGITSSLYNVYIMNQSQSSSDEMEGQTNTSNAVNYYALPPSISALQFHHSPYLQPISTNHITQTPNRPTPNRPQYEGVPRLNI